MDRRQDYPEEDAPPRTVVRFSEDWNTAEAVLKDGVEVDGMITSYQERPDPNDDEHRIIRLGYKYEVDGQVFEREMAFSINTVHIAYGFEGGLIGVPKFKHSLDDFIHAMQPGRKLKIKTLPKPPYWFLVEPNEVMQEVMRHDAVWM